MIKLEKGFTLNINTGGAIEITKFDVSAITNYGGTLHINGGSLSVRKGQNDDQTGIRIGSTGIFKYSSGTIDATDKAVISFAETAIAEGVSGKFIDGDFTLADNNKITIGEDYANPSADGLTAGYYNWNISKNAFEKQMITIEKQPEGLTVTEGSISGGLSVTARASNSETISYQWGIDPIEGAVSNTYTLPTDLTVESYKYSCRLMAKGCSSVTTQIVTVTVIPVGGASTYDVMVNNGIANPPTVAKNAIVTITANPAPGGQRFKEWIVDSGDVTLANATSATTTFTMPANDVCIKATYISEGGSSSGGNSSGGASSGGSSSGSSPSSETTITKITTKIGNQPNQPITATISVTAAAGRNAGASVSTPDIAITDAISKAQAEAIKQGKTANGISVELNIIMPKGSTSLATTLSQNALKSLVSAGVTSLEINGSPVMLTFDQESLTEIQKQSRGNLIITITSQMNLSEVAKEMVGSRPIYNITISYGNNGTVSSFGNGVATVGIPYTPTNSEAISGLYAVYVDENGNATRVDASAYDVNNGCVIFTTQHFSMYGIGYTSPSAKFADIKEHWAKENIDYVVDRGLLCGTTETTFAPNIDMTRGMFVTALGRLAGVDLNSYDTSSFTDVKVGSTFQPYIEWAYKKEIIRGIGNKQFAPDRPITREEIAVIVTNFARATGYTLSITRDATTYADDSAIGSTYKTAVTLMQQADIMTGGTNNKFNPKSNATRAEVSTMLQRYIKLHH